MAFWDRLRNREKRAGAQSGGLYLYAIGPGGVVPLKATGSPLYDAFHGLLPDNEQELTNDARGWALAYRASVWVYRCVKVRAQTLASIPLLLKDANGELLASHPLAPVFSVTNSRLMYTTECDLLVYGAAFWSFGLDRATGRAWVQRLNPQTIEVVADSSGVQEYIQRIDGRVVARWAPHELVALHDYNPADDLGGVSPVAVALKAVGVTINIAAFAEYFFRNGAIPAGILTTQQRLTDSDRQRIEIEWRRRFQGTERAHGTAILEGGLFEYQVVTQPLKDLAMVELREEERRDICAALGVPMSIAQAADPALYAARQDYANFHTLTILPELDQIVDTLNSRLVPRYGIPGARLEPDTSQIEALQEDLVEISQRNQIGVAAGYLSINEAREREGLEPLPVDAFIIGGQLVPRRDIEAGVFDVLRPQPANPFALPPLRSAPVVQTDDGALIGPGFIIDAEVSPRRNSADAWRELALADLRRWQRKVAKKGATATFESDYIPDGITAWLRADLAAWDGETPRDEWIERAFAWAAAQVKAEDDELATPDEFTAYWRGFDQLFELVAAAFEGVWDDLPARLAAALREGGKEKAELMLAEFGSTTHDLLVQRLVGTAEEPGPLVRVFLAGAARGEELLRQGKAQKDALTIDWALVHKLALEWARQYAVTMVRGINDTTLDTFRQAITEWMNAGGSLEDLAKALEGDLSGLDMPPNWSGWRLRWATSRERARLIAQTETTRAFTEGSVARWTQAGVQKARWRTNQDAHVCPICGALNNTIAELHDVWVHPQTGKRYRPPAHPGCRCFLAPVVELEADGG
jgi:HK97 family phage portal protein